MFDKNQLAVTDLRTGGVDANLADFPVAFVDAKESGGKLEVLDIQIDPAPYGIGVRKESTELNSALQRALDNLMTGVVYDDILKTWSLRTASLSSQ